MQRALLRAKADVAIRGGDDQRAVRCQFHHIPQDWAELNRLVPYARNEEGSQSRFPIELIRQNNGDSISGTLPVDCRLLNTRWSGQLRLLVSAA